MQRVARSDTCYSLQLFTSLCAKCAKFRDNKNGQGRAPKVGDTPNFEEIWAHTQRQQSIMQQRQQKLQEMKYLNLCFFSEDQEEIESNFCYQVQSQLKSVITIAKVKIVSLSH